MHELVTVYHDAHMRRTPCDRVKEDQIAGLEIVEFDFPSDLELILHVAREGDPMSGKDPLREPAAVESRGVAAAVAVRSSAEAESSFDDRLIAGRNRHRRWCGRLRL